VGVIHMLVFVVCWGEEKVKTLCRWCRCIETCRRAYGVENIINIYVVHLLAWIINSTRCTAHTLKYSNSPLPVQ
jgi:hypothetical protein